MPSGGHHSPTAFIFLVNSHSKKSLFLLTMGLAGRIRYKRKLLTKAGEVKLYVPRQRTLPLKMQVIERHETKQNSLAAAAHRFAMNTTR